MQLEINDAIQIIHSAHFTKSNLSISLIINLMEAETEEMYHTSRRDFDTNKWEIMFIFRSKKGNAAISLIAENEMEELSLRVPVFSLHEKDQIHYLFCDPIVYGKSNWRMR